MHAIDWREFTAAMVAAIAVGLVTMRILVWLDERAVLAAERAEPPIGDQIWRVLAEARQITIDAAQED